MQSIICNTHYSIYDKFQMNILQQKLELHLANTQIVLKQATNIHFTCFIEGFQTY